MVSFSVMFRVSVSARARVCDIDSVSASVSFLVNIMFEIVGREVPLSLSLHTGDGYTRLALCIALFFMEI